jgi:hypothetical protein
MGIARSLQSVAEPECGPGRVPGENWGVSVILV